MKLIDYKKKNNKTRHHSQEGAGKKSNETDRWVGGRAGERTDR